MNMLLVLATVTVIVIGEGQSVLVTPAPEPRVAGAAVLLGEGDQPKLVDEGKKTDAK